MSIGSRDMLYLELIVQEESRKVKRLNIMKLGSLKCSVFIHYIRIFLLDLDESEKCSTVNLNSKSLILFWKLDKSSIHLFGDIFQAKEGRNLLDWIGIGTRHNKSFGHPQPPTPVWQAETRYDGLGSQAR